MPVKHTHAYAFAELGSDLGSGGEVKGNPTQFFRRAGFGASYGVGIKLNQARVEYIRDCNSGTGAFHARFGERF